MISMNELQYYSSLLTKKYRKKENKFIVEGKKSVLEGLNSSYKCEVVFITNKFSDENEEMVADIDSSKNIFVTLKQKEFEKISDTKTPDRKSVV